MAQIAVRDHTVKVYGLRITLGEDITMEDEEDLAGEEDTDWSCEQSTSADIQVQPQFSHQSLKEVSPNRTVQKRTIVHIDIDCFYAQVEMIRNPELRDKPLEVPTRHVQLQSSRTGCDQNDGG
ncbi:hypothetical protein ScPMuIL_018608 [Solemya velum]